MDDEAVPVWDQEDAATLQEYYSGKNKPRWLLRTLKDAQENVQSPKSAMIESKPLQRYGSYGALIAGIREREPSSYEEAADLRKMTLCGSVPLCQRLNGERTNATGSASLAHRTSSFKPREGEKKRYEGIKSRQ